jgi:hypothetical protein
MMSRTNGPINALADFSKWGVVSNFEVAQIHQVDRLITDEQLGKIAREALTKAGRVFYRPGRPGGAAPSCPAGRMRPAGSYPIRRLFHALIRSPEEDHDPVILCHRPARIGTDLPQIYQRRQVLQRQRAIMGGDITGSCSSRSSGRRMAITAPPSRAPSST